MFANSAVRRAALTSRVCKVKVPPAATYTPSGLTLDTLPADVLLRVWVYLDEPGQLAWTSRLHALSQDTMWRAKWFMHRYELYEVVFEAIARPNIFTVELFRALTRLGAPLTRNVVQLLHLMSHRLCMESTWRDSSIHWGRISFSAYAGVIGRAALLFNKGISLQSEGCQSLIFSRCLDSQKRSRRSSVDPQVSNEVTEMFQRNRFMPLELEVVDDGNGGYMVARRQGSLIEAISYDPDLLAFALNNGFVLDLDRLEAIVQGWCQNFGQARVKMFIRELKVDNVIHVTKQHVKETFDAVTEPRVIVSLRPTASQPPCLSIPHFQERQDAAFAKRDLFVHLDQTHALPFRLLEVVHNVPVPLTWQGAQKRKAVQNEQEDETATAPNKEVEEKNGDKRRRARSGRFIPSRVAS